MSLSPFLSELFLIKTGQIPKPEKKKTQPIRKRSKKEMVRHRQYVKMIVKMFEEDDNCEVRIPGICTGKMQGGQHKKRRGVNLFKHVLRSCNACNFWAELNPKEAIKMGIAIPVHQKESVAVATYDQNLKAIIIN